jgi:hypothetical protein
MEDVIFRFGKYGVFALFPHNVEDSKGHVLSYTHVGQHSVADYDYCIRISKPATEEQYKQLEKELTSIGYELNIIKRRNYDKYLKSYYANNR